MKRQLSKDELKEMLAEYGEIKHIDGHDCMCGRTWVTGGERWDWYGNKKPAEPDEPRKFVELHKFFKDNFPNLHYTEYLEIEDECIATHTDHESDYYSNYVVVCWIVKIDVLAGILPPYVEYDFEMTCKHCGTTFKFNKEDIDNVEGGLMGDWDCVWCPGCNGYVETYPKNRIKLHE